MVNVFIIHSGNDYEFVKDQLEPFLRGEKDEQGREVNAGGSANILTLASGKRSPWKLDALKKIKMAQAVIIVVGSDSSKPGKEKTMGWEVDQAIRHNKMLMIYNRGGHPIPNYLIKQDHFSNQAQPAAKSMTMPQIKKRLDDYARGHYDIFSPEYESLDIDEKLSHKDELLAQYQMFQRTSEDLVARRQSVNSFYITVNSVLVTLVGLVIGVVDAPVSLIVVGCMCLGGITLDVSWISLLDSYGTLNSAKMKVINLLEEQLPVALYDAEWRVMSDKLNSKKYVSFTDSEKRTPIIFTCIYAICIIITLIYFIVHYMQ